MYMSSKRKHQQIPDAESNFVWMAECFILSSIGKKKSSLKQWNFSKLCFGLQPRIVTLGSLEARVKYSKVHKSLTLVCRYRLQL